jgi:UPF0176 protein
MQAVYRSGVPRIRAMPAFAVAAAYRFVDLPDAATLRAQWFDSAQAAALKGTLLVATEGLNFTLAGEPAALEGWLKAVQADARLAGLDIKRHGHDALPFRHLRVKLKNEIIRMNQPVVRPQAARAPELRVTGMGRRCGGKIGL